MARRLGPKHKLCRRVGERLCASDKCPAVRRPYAPGAHGPSQGRLRLTTYGTQLREKQKAKTVYGILERQFRRYFEDAKRKKGDTAEFLIRLLEMRLDNVIFRLGLAKTRDQARQLVSHGHITVDGKRVNIPSFQVRVGQAVAVSDKSKSSPYFAAVLPGLAKREPPSWLSIDPAAGAGKILSNPSGEELKQNFDTNMIIEFYSR
ncbi:30S ribosomal protein S4 [Candidatus Uhrbacteria bacterium RIFCSPHIGHO2_12_FULL_57_11]|uniref:Small ribosomal subunit protein uS4 n=2 Tax=Candidatus Uhriibacteriota TaxID=1752732 RepID=A0A1F7UMM9_9BACT|nr:MAG: 30S ribosomal protein S4 [Candidatus Uhrbacteria bacterium RIFCSPHIGHO2_02_FULL_57_19]OGL78968.1 MAG: 30S ribosomal protein S4 [Candidatus Uhrbacteria bacterium RIFCSPHIGHO2_12_FULL_57_11]